MACETTRLVFLVWSCWSNSNKSNFENVGPIERSNVGDRNNLHLLVIVLAYVVLSLLQCLQESVRMSTTRDWSWNESTHDRTTTVCIIYINNWWKGLVVAQSCVDLTRHSDNCLQDPQDEELMFLYVVQESLFLNGLVFVYAKTVFLMVSC